MVGVVDVAREQRTYELDTLVGTTIGGEGLRLLGGRQHADEVQRNATLESRVVRRRRRRGALLREPTIEHAVDRVRAASLGGGEHRLTRTQRRLVGGLLEGEAFGPHGTLLDPRAERGDFGRTQPVALGRHADIRIGADDRFKEFALLRLDQRYDGAVLAAFEQRGTGIHRESALLLVARVTLTAVLA